ncbi:MAG: hypothetical protein MR504_02890 [Methanobrevibacter woesei]|uniref:hypothetical protein n=1 Tax=Methanobrevibacter woesei TaxID=190976 RepID=UPI0023F4F431|nr:hypothetical protein [Methanobrevibacter woesei]MCI7291129.1 hypothetical protein [Methanobrevibacter woesei]
MASRQFILTLSLILIITVCIVICAVLFVNIAHENDNNSSVKYSSGNVDIIEVQGPTHYVYMNSEPSQNQSDDEKAVLLSESKFDVSNKELSDNLFLEEPADVPDASDIIINTEE